MSRRAVETFAPAHAHAVAAGLAGDVHLWWLPYDRTQGRAPLRALLAAYLDTEPDALALVEDAHGRPRLAGPRGLDFNWSHSGEHALVALARELPVLGVDIERHRARPRALALAERFFAPDEHAALIRRTPASRDDAFIRLWTAKEAVLKGHGRGLAYGLDRVVFALDEAGAQPQRFDGEIGAADQWQLRAVAPTPALLGTLAWRGMDRRVCGFRPIPA